MFVACVATIDATWRATAHVKFPPKRNDAEEETCQNAKQGALREFWQVFDYVVVLNGASLETIPWQVCRGHKFVFET